MNATLKNAMTIEAAGGAILASAWTNGTRGRTTRKPTPAFCGEFSALRAVLELRGKSLATARRLIRKHPRAQTIIAVTDRRGLNKAAGAVQ